MKSLLGKPASFCFRNPVFSSYSTTLLDGTWLLEPFTIVYGTSSDAAESLVAFSYLEFIDWFDLAPDKLSNVPWVYYTLETVVAIMPFLPLVLYEM